MALAPDLVRRSICELETIGRRTGLPRRIEIWFAAEPGSERIFMLSGGRDRADWVRNIRADGRVRVRLGGRWFDGAATEIEGGPDEGLARQLLAAKYQGWVSGASLSTWARDSLPVAIDLKLADSSCEGSPGP